MNILDINDKQAISSSAKIGFLESLLTEMFVCYISILNLCFVFYRSMY